MDIPIDVWTHIIEYVNEASMDSLILCMKWCDKDCDRIRLHFYKEQADRLYKNHDIYVDEIERHLYLTRQRIDEYLEDAIIWCRESNRKIDKVDPLIKSYFRKLFCFEFEERITMEYIHGVIDFLSSKSSTLLMIDLDYSIQNEQVLLNKCIQSHFLSTEINFTFVSSDTLKIPRFGDLID